jgi:membrane protein DedA with SNARE-associated domain
LEQVVLNFINDVYQTVGWPGVIMMMAIESACIPLPSEIIMPMAGWMLVESHGLGFWYIILAGFCGAVGNVIGSLIAYWVGYKGGLPFLRRYGKYVLISNNDLERSTRWFDRYGDWITFGARLLPAVRTFISFPAGIAKMNIFKFSFFAFIGSFIWSTVLAYGGYVLGQNWEELREAMRPFDYPIIAICIILIIVFIWMKLRKKKSSLDK